MTTKKVTLKDLTPKKTTAVVKGGSIGFGYGKANDNITLVRGAKPPKKRDLPPRKDIKGGKKYTGNDNITLVRGAKPRITKDLPSKKPAAVKGGRPAHD